MVSIDFFNLNLDELINSSNILNTKNVILNEEKITISDEELVNLCNTNPELSEDGKIYLESLLQFWN